MPALCRKSNLGLETLTTAASLQQQISVIATTSKNFTRGFREIRCTDHKAVESNAATCVMVKHIHYLHCMKLRGNTKLGQCPICCIRMHDNISFWPPIYCDIICFQLVRVYCGILVESTVACNDSVTRSRHKNVQARANVVSELGKRYDWLVVWLFGCLAVWLVVSCLVG